ncbi:MAG TPA: phosphoglycerate dehydrogenase [Candidatus Methylomirabilis sp.]|nr:phosphoglycerate dehydrogenase [Candidatus Methylomirabilis sp.]
MPNEPDVKIVVPDDFPPALTGSVAEAPLKALGQVRVFTERGADQEATLIERVGDAQVVVNIRAHARFTDRVLAACPALRLISIWGAGTDNVDLVACRARGVTVTNTPGVNAHALAEHTIALMLAITRRIPAMDRDVRAGQWPRGLLIQLEGKTLGLIGLGAIGSRVAALARPFGLRLLASTFGPDNGRAAALGAQHVGVEQLLRESDIVSLHLRLSADTEGYLSRARLGLMKPTAFLINTARGGLVDKQALIDALREKRLAGAALDVFHEEPVRPDDPLLALPDLVLTPHNGGMTREVIDNGVLRAVENVQLFLAGRPRDLVVAPPARR